LKIFIGSKIKGTECPKDQSRNGRKSKRKKNQKGEEGRKTFNGLPEENRA